jgi:hypothetical protein
MGLPLNPAGSESARARSMNAAMSRIGRPWMHGKSARAAPRFVKEAVPR